MKATGNTLVALCLLALVSVNSQAAVTASLDRDRVAMGDTMRLTITATENEEVSGTDLRPLLADFEILQRSTSSNTSITNGRRMHTKQMLLDITPRKEGTLKVPPLRVGQQATNLLLVSVGPAPASNAGGQTVIFEAEIDRDTAFVQGQVILTLRVQQAINLEARSISELQLDNAFVKPLEQNSFQRNIDGRPWLVHEVRYAIFPEQSGSLEIPVQTFSARESQARRSFFDLGGAAGRQLRRTTETLNIEVLPRPDEFPASTWLPARKLVLEENWSTPPEQLRAGESATRTIRILGEGLQGAQLPPVLFPATDGLKYYPDQPVIGDKEVTSGLLGTRQDSAAVVPTRAGKWSIPEIRIPWWDTESGAIRYAILPGRELTVAAAEPTVATQTLAPSLDIISPGSSTATAPDGSTAKPWPWQLLSAFSSIGWLLTVAYLVWSRRGRAKTGTRQALGDNPGEYRAFKQVLAACAGDSAVPARQAIIDWAGAMSPRSQAISLSDVATVFSDEAFSAQLADLNASIYSPDGSAWQGTALADTVRRLRRERKKEDKHTDQELELYPQAA